MKLLSVLLLFFLILSVSTFAQKNAKVGVILSTLESKAKGVNSIRADFVQTKKLAVFTKEITIKGAIAIQKPNLFAWHVTSPVKYGLVVKGDEILQWNADTNKVQKISMKGNPAFEAIFEQMNGWLSGNYKSLAPNYEISIETEKPLVLKFIPLRSATSYKFIKSITIFFDKDPRYIKKFVIIEKNGDQTILKFLNTKLNTKIPANKWQPKF